MLWIKVEAFPPTYQDKVQYMEYMVQCNMQYTTTEYVQLQKHIFVTIYKIIGKLF